jgi:hypothetical protein
MLKKAGIVVLGAAAGMGVLAPAAFAGEAPSHDGHSKSWDRDDDHGHHRGHHHGHDRDRDRDRDCGDVADARGSKGLVNAPNLLANADVSRLNILASDDSVNFGGSCRGGGDVADARGSSGLVNAPNLLANPDVSRLNVLASDDSVNF